jgi:transcriptional regulator with XRE-family HTH domain
VEISLVIKQRLSELGLEQKGLAAAAAVTDSYVSQLLSGKKSPPAPDRTDIYAKMERFLRLPAGRLADLAGQQRKDEIRRNFIDSPAPLFQGVRELILRKCVPEKKGQVSAIFETQPFGELERLVTQKLLDVAKRIAREELDSDNWLHLVARMSGRTYEEMRVTILEFLDTDIFNISVENCVSFLDPLIDSWDIDLATFGIEIVLNKRLAPGNPKKFEFVETEAEQPAGEEPGFREFLESEALNANATLDEIAFLRNMRFRGKRPVALYYYRALQNLRDPLHFREASSAPMHKYGEAGAVEKQMQLHARQGAVARWASQKGKRKRPPK